MRKLRWTLLIVVTLSVTAFGTLSIDRFDATITLDPTGHLVVEEQITATFFTPHHGIEREIPVSYRNPATGGTTTIGFHLDRITMDGESVPYLSRRRGSEQYLRIGDADRTLVGTATYTIAYTVDRALLFHEDYLQIYWNVTGNDWRIPIDAATATFRFPATVEPDTVRATSYVGYTGSVARGFDATMDNSGALRFETGLLSPGQGLTIDVSIPRTQLAIEPPSFGQRVLWFLSANKYAALPIVVLIGMFILWARIGRDPRTGIIAPTFAPPDGMTAGDVGVLIDDRIDLRDISAMLIGLAVKGHLTIEEIDEDESSERETVRSQRKTPDDYRFVRKPSSTGKVSQPEQLMLDAIFDKKHETERTLSSLEHNFYQHLPAIKSALYAGLIERGFYPGNPERARRFYVTLGTMGLVGGIGVALAYASVYLGAAIALSGLIVLGFSRFMPRKTQQGVRALEEVLGLSEYIRRAEVDRMEFHDAPEKSPELFERLLPYALALNLTKIWTKQFEGLLVKPPDWYVGSAGAFRGHWFALSMLHLSSGMNSTFASAPRGTGGKSAWSGGSSFGGGFSGGGFGGGGGGGW